MKSKLTNFIKEHLLLVSIASAALVALAVSAIVTAIAFSALGSAAPHEKDGITDSNAENRQSLPNIQIPPFPRSPKSLEQGDGYVSEYYTQVTEEQINEYAELIEARLQVEFSEGEYPRIASAQGNRIILHYSKSEQKMSVTVVTVAAE